ncbi:MAG: VCBS repeat-containing protein [Lunatimonas sp.]|uniref:FG-GAP repeat domain-containing protein n=1 Tax=Lunatimonas sp. TaxID=2060141 RepID=UPI00263B87C7|nr:VCBS repeat-containing protein [Lunatimonas sp.]MCC5936327.1 VCBS repeat-containing protein [Lunatimonas sp.]
MMIPLFFLLLVLPYGGIFAQSKAFSDGQPWKMHVIDDTSLGADGAKLADVNGDGFPDLVSGWEEGGVSRLYINPGRSGADWTYVEVPSPDVEDAFAVDLDGDGFMDLVTLSEGAHQRITIHWAPADWDAYYQSDQWISQDIPVTVGMTRWMFGRAIDVDGNFGLDLIVGSKDPNGRIGWLEAPENPRDMAQWKYHPISDAGWIMSIETLDMDGDGTWDLLITDRYGAMRGLRWLKNPGNPGDHTTEWENHYIGLRDGEPMFLGFAAVDEWVKDGIPGIIVPDLTNGWEFFYREDGTWHREFMSYPTFSGSRGKSVAVADINEDGVSDFVASFEGARDRSGVLAVTAFLSDQPAFVDISGTEGIKYDFVVLLDMDGDGDLDVLTCEETGGDGSKQGLGIIWYENPLR